MFFRFRAEILAVITGRELFGVQHIRGVRETAHGMAFARGRGRSACGSGSSTRDVFAFSVAYAMLALGRVWVGEAQVYESLDVSLVPKNESDW